MSILWDNIIFFVTQIVQIIIFVAGCYFFSISVFGWIKRKETPAVNCYIPQKKFALIIAAHNEELVIAHIIDSLSRQNYPSSLYRYIRNCR